MGYRRGRARVRSVAWTRKHLPKVWKEVNKSQVYGGKHKHKKKRHIQNFVSLKSIQKLKSKIGNPYKLPHLPKVIRSHNRPVVGKGLNFMGKFRLGNVISLGGKMPTMPKFHIPKWKPPKPPKLPRLPGLQNLPKFETAGLFQQVQGGLGKMWDVITAPVNKSVKAANTFKNILVYGGMGVVALVVYKILKK